MSPTHNAVVVWQMEVFALKKSSSVKPVMEQIPSEHFVFFWTTGAPQPFKRRCRVWCTLEELVSFGHRIVLAPAVDPFIFCVREIH